jgi:hypothetical protein
MKIIRDKNDPSRMGMYSKTGRFTTEKMYILRKRDEILSSEKRTKKIPLFRASSKIVREKSNNP